MTLQLKVQKLHPKAKLPTKATDGSAGWDLYLLDDVYKLWDPQLVGVGIAVEIPEGHVGLLVERSSNWKRGLYQENKIGVIDSDYRGEIMIPLSVDKSTEAGTRVAQLVIVPVPEIELIEVDAVSSTERGEGGFGSTGS